MRSLSTLCIQLTRLFQPAVQLRTGLRPFAHIPYRHPRGGRLRADERNTWRFSCGGVEGVNIQDCLDGNLESLDDGLEELLPAAYMKVTVHIEVRVGNGAGNTLKC